MATVHAPKDPSAVPFPPEIETYLPEGPLVEVPLKWASQSTAPARRRIPIRPNDADLTKQHDAPPAGQHIVLSGRVLNAAGDPIPDTLIETWQCNASGAYVDPFDPGEKPLDPNFTGAGRCVTGPDGEFRFVTIKPAAYSGPSGSNVPFRPAHIHISFIGPDVTNRLITQVYFEGEPFYDTDFVIDIMNDPDRHLRERLVAKFDAETTKIGGPDAAIGYRWDVILGGQDATPMEW